jgi:hypothetical protein
LHDNYAISTLDCNLQSRFRFRSLFHNISAFLLQLCITSALASEVKEKEKKVETKKDEPREKRNLRGFGNYQGAQSQRREYNYNGAGYAAPPPNFAGIY